MLDIPNNRLNGYNIIAQGPVHKPVSSVPVYALLGHDPSRRYPAYVTALATQSSVTNFREWFWGHYFENGKDAFHLALADWIKRLGFENEAIADIVQTLVPVSCDRCGRDRVSTTEPHTIRDSSDSKECI